MRVAEIYKSIQGEGLLAGTESVFMRASGCNLRCWFCDTPYASWQPLGDDQSVPEILEQMLSWDCHHVVLTGGEPMIFSELIPLSRELAAAGRHVTIETAGTLDLPVHADLMSISPKLANSDPSADDHPRWRRRHRQSRHAPDVLRRLVRDHAYQLKFVVDTRTDCLEVEEYLAQFPLIHRDRVYLMPQGTSVEELQERAEWLIPYCRDQQLRYCPRMQIEWFGLRMGT